MTLFCLCIDANKGNADSSGEEDTDDEDENTNKSQSETHDLVSVCCFTFVFNCVFKMSIVVPESLFGICLVVSRF